MEFTQEFLSFVAIRVNNSIPNSYEYKAIRSFSDIARQIDYPVLEYTLRYWLASMIDKGVSATVRTRYIDKLHFLYREYTGDKKDESDPFQYIRQANKAKSNNHESVSELCKRIDQTFNNLLLEARNNPALAIFIYLLLNASSDIKKAIGLCADDYEPIFIQLDDIIKPASFHHRRKYIFDLNQSRKRLPQLIREVISTINTYLSDRGIRSTNLFSDSIILSIWIEKAKYIGINLREIASVLDTIPTEYDYLQLIPKAELSIEQKNAIKMRVANAFSPTDKRWYVLKLKRGVAYADLLADIKENLPDIYSEYTFFYPRKEVSRRVDKKIVTEHIPVIPDIVFFKTKPHHVATIDRRLKSNNTGWVFRYVNSPESGYSVIDKQSMLNFQKMIGISIPGMSLELSKDSPIGIGRKVRITGGIMKGYKGVIHDIKNSDDNTRIFYIKLSENISIKAELNIEESFVEPIENIQ